MRLRLATCLFFSTFCLLKAQINFSHRETWDGPFDIKMIAAPNLEPVYPNRTQAASNVLMVDSLIQYKTIQMSGDLFVENNDYKEGTPFKEYDIPVPALSCPDPKIPCFSGFNVTGSSSSCAEVYGAPQKVKRLVAMNYADYDDDLSTFSSSTAYLDISQCSEIEAAYLYWAGNFKTTNTNISLFTPVPRVSNGKGSFTGSYNAGHALGKKVFDISQASGYDKVQFKVPGGNYKEVSAIKRTITTSDVGYICVANVTDMVKGSSGGGNFWVGNIQSYPMEQKGGSTSGWVLVVVYKSPLSPPRRISLFDGYEDVSQGDPLPIVLSGLQAPATSDFKSYIGYASIDGENTAGKLKNSGQEDLDFITDGTNPVAAHINPFRTDQPKYKAWTKDGYPGKNGYSNNMDNCKKPLFDASWTEVFDGMTSSHITSYDETTDLNGNEIKRLPDIVNTLGFDAHHLKLPEGAVAPNATKATMTINSGNSGSTMPFMAYIAIERLQPKLALSKKADKDQTTTGVKRIYTLKVENQGNQDSFGGDVLTDTLDLVTKYAGNLTATHYVNGNPGPGTIVAPVITATSAGEELKFIIPAIKRKDSIVFSFEVDVLPVSDPVAGPLYLNQCKRTIFNTAWIEYKKNLANEKLKSKSNSKDCNNGSEVKIVITGLGNSPEVLDTVDASAFMNESIVKHVRRQIFVQNHAGAADTAAYLVFDTGGNRIPASEIFPATSGTVTYEAYRNLSGAGCQDKISITFKFCTMPEFKITQPPALCGGTFDLATAVSDLIPTNAVLSFYEDTTAAPLSSATVSSSNTFYVKATNNGCTTKYLPGKVIVTIHAVPTATVTQPAAQCKGNLDLATYVTSSPGSVLSFYSDLAGTLAVTNPVTTSGTYYVKATANGCSNSPLPGITVQIDADPNLVITNPAGMCQAPGTTANLTAPAITAGSTGISGPLTYFTDASATTTLASPAAVSPSLTTTYYIKATNGTCAVVKPVTVVIHPLPSAEITGSTEICPEDGSKKLAITFTGSAPFTLEYTEPSGTPKTINAPTFTAEIPVPAQVSGDFTLTKVEDVHGCSTISFSQAKAIVSRISPVVISNPAKSCDYAARQATIRFEISGGKQPYTFSAQGTFTDPLFTATFNANGNTTFDYKVSDATGCTANTNVTAYSGSADCGCPVSASIANATASSPYICNDGVSKAKITVTTAGSLAGAGAVYNFSVKTPGGMLTESDAASSTGNSFEFEVALAGEYELISVNDQNCTGAVSGKAIVQLLTPKVIITGDSVFCSNDRTGFLTASDLGTGTDPATGTGPSYSWTSARGTVNGPALPRTNLVNGETVTVTLTPGYSCAGASVKATKTITIYEKPVPVITAASEICPGETAVLKAAGGNPLLPSAYTWYKSGSPTGNNTAELTATETGIYKVKITNALTACSSEASHQLTVQQVFADAGPDRHISLGETTYLHGSATQNSKISWTDSISLSDPAILTPVVKTTETTTYTLYIKTNLGCMASDQVTVFIYKPVTIPNAFTPNGDGVNDYWVIEGIEKFPATQVKVFNRWGSGIFENKEGYKAPWDGTHNGNSLPAGTYYFVVDLKGSPDNSDKSVTGSLTIIR